MNAAQIIKDAEGRMEKALDVFRNQLKGLRTGRASPAMLEGVRVDYYGSPTPVPQMSSITVPEARMAVIKPYDTSQLGAECGGEAGYQYNQKCGCHRPSWQIPPRCR